MKWYHWMLIPLVVLAAVIAYLFGKQRRSVSDLIADEIEIIEAKAEARKREIEVHANAAREWIARTYQMEIKRLDDEQKKRAGELRDDPPALAEYIIRTARNCSSEPG